MKRGVERCDRSAIDNGTYLQAVIVVNPNTVHHIRIFLAAHIIIIQIKIIQKLLILVVLRGIMPLGLPLAQRWTAVVKA